MPKLNEKNAKFAVIKTAFHNGGTIGFYNSLAYAEKIANDNTQKECCCGCCGVVPVNELGRKEMQKNGYLADMLYDEYPTYSANSEHYSQLCR